MESTVSLVAYGLACLAALIVAARWIARHHPALRESDESVPGPDDPPDSPTAGR